MENQNVPTQPIPPVTHSNNKYVIGIVGLVILILVATTSYLLGKQSVSQKSETQTPTMIAASPTAAELTPTAMQVNPVETIKNDLPGYSNSEYNFTFTLAASERVIACPNTNEQNENMAAWITNSPLPTPAASGESLNECATEGPEVSVFASKKASGLNTIDDFIKQIETDYQITKEEITIAGVKGYHVKGTRKNADPAPIPDSVDRVYIAHNGVNYIIHASFLERNFKFLK